MDKLRFVYINDQVENLPFDYPNNKITYYHSIRIFWKKFLFEHYCRFIYIFLFIVAIVQIVPSLSSIGSFTTLGPLLFCYGITLIINLLVALKQQIFLDEEYNFRPVNVLRGQNFHRDESYKLVPGDIILVNNNETVPADIVLLATENDENIAMVDSCEPVSEVTFSIKHPLSFSAALKDPQSISELSAKISCTNSGIVPSDFNGSLHHDRIKDSIGYTNLILKNSRLVNTKWIYGVVMYTGSDALVSKRRTTTDHQSNRKSILGRVERMTNYFSIILFILNIVLAIISIIVFKVMDKDDAWYLLKSSTYMAKIFFTSVILYSSIFGATLYFCIDIIKLINFMFINYSIEGSRFFRKSAKHVHELGQVGYIFSNKTATLTRNEMVLQKCIIGGKVLSVEECNVGEALVAGSGGEDASQNIFGGGQKRMAVTNDTLEFFMALLACHSVFTEDGIIFNGSSEDEMAILKAIRQVGITLNNKNGNHLNYTMKGEVFDFEVIEMIGFTSTTRKMSVIIRNPVNNQYTLYMKGASEIIDKSLGESQQHLDETRQHLESFESQGYRTMCLAQRNLSEDMATRWVQEYRLERSQNNTTELIGLERELEQQLILLGATVIEDSLQNGVKETIQRFTKSGIKYFLLTSNNMGSACQIIQDQTSTTIEMMTLNQQSETECTGSINEYLGTIVNRVNKHHNQLALVFSGSILNYLKTNENTKFQFIRLAQSCSIIIGYNMTPKQKAYVYDIIKTSEEGSKSITLAVGNDFIGMADLSVKIIDHSGGVDDNGIEVMTTDYSIQEFRLLDSLLLFHGRNSYSRLVTFIHSFIYKSVAIGMTQFWFGIFNGYSGSNLYESVTLALYHILFTLFSTISIGIFNRSARYNPEYPETYQAGQKLEQFTFKSFSINMFWAFYHSVLIFFIPVFSVRGSSIYSDGQIIDGFNMGVLVFTSLIFVINFNQMIETVTHNFITAIIFALNFIIYFAWTLIACSFNIDGFYEYEMLSHLYQSAKFYFVLILVTIFSIAPVINVKYTCRNCRPTKEEIDQEIEKSKKE